MIIINRLNKRVIFKRLKKIIIKVIIKCFI